MPQRIASEKLVAPTDWFYYYIVTATTIGYGDLSPQTPAGRWVAILWLLPGGVTLFAMFIGKATTGLIDTWRRRAMSKHSYPGMSHAFARNNGIHYDKANADLANGRTLDFFTGALN